jgi:hypothetical protein
MIRDASDWKADSYDAEPPPCRPHSPYPDSTVLGFAPGVACLPLFLICRGAEELRARVHACHCDKAYLTDWASCRCGDGLEDMIMGEKVGTEKGGEPGSQTH